MNQTQIAQAAQEGLAAEKSFNAQVAALQGDVASRAWGVEQMRDARAHVDHPPLSWTLTPKIFSAAGVRYLNTIAATVSSVMEKVTQAYVEDASVRAAFGLSPQEEELILLDPGYSVQVPLARADIFLNEKTGDFSFCEFNTDGSTGMFDMDHLASIVQASQSFKNFAASEAQSGNAITTWNCVQNCMDAIFDAFSQWAGENRLPTSLAVVDYLESLCADDAYEFCKLFERLGVHARISDVRALRIEEHNGTERLCDDEGPIECVWRRVLVPQMIEKGGADVLVEALQHRLCCVVGSFRSWPMATKNAFFALYDNRVLAYLNEQEREFVKRHVPYTQLLQSASETELVRFTNRQNWILKPAAGWDAQGVIAGKDCSDKQWMRALEQARHAPVVIQAYAPQFASDVYIGATLGVVDTSTTPVAANMMEGLFIWRGELGGIYTRCGRDAIIGEGHDWMLTPAFKMETARHYGSTYAKVTGDCWYFV